MNKQLKNKTVITSFRPLFADLIFSGQKVIEFRKKFVSLVPGDKILIYVSGRGKNPSKLETSCLSGSAKVKSFQILSLQEAWKIAKNTPGETYEEFVDYYKDTEVATVIELEEIKIFKAITLNELKNFDIKPPVSWCFASDKLLKYLY